MSETQGINFLIFHVISPAILLIGWIGNVTGLVVLFRKNLAKLGPVLMYRTLFVSDTLYLFNVFPLYLKVFNIQIITNSLSCKFSTYIGSAFSSFAPSILVYISVDRFISIGYVKRDFLKKTNVQLAYLLILVLLELVIYIPFYIYSDNYTDANNITNCLFFNSDSIRILNFLKDVTARNLIVILMFLFSVLLIIKIINSRRRSLENYTTTENRTFRKDIRLSVTSILLNFVYIVFTLPATLVTFVFTSVSYNLVVFFYYFYFTNFTSNFYLILISNSLFRREVFSLFKKNTNRPLHHTF